MIHINEQKKRDKSSIKFLLLYAIFILFLTSSFGFTLQNVILQLTSMAVVYFVLKRRWQKYFMYALFICAVIFSPQIISSLYALFNGVTTRLELQYGIDLLQIANGKMTIVGLFIIWLVVHLLLLYFKSSKVIISLLIAFFIVFITLQLQQYSLFFITLVSGLLLIGEMKRKIKQSWRIQLPTYAFLMTAIVVLVFMINKFEHPFQQIPQQTQQKIEDLRFNSENESWLSEGNLANTPKKNNHTNTAAIIMMEQPQAMYLKGFVGSRFDDEMWQALSNKQALENEALFYWLGEEQFKSQTTLSNLQAVIKKQDYQSVAIQIEDASTKYTLLPYEVANIDKLSTIQKDGATYNSGFLGEENYTFKMANHVGENYPLLAAQIEKMNSKEVADYLKLEANYRAFVYDTYVKVGQEERLILQDDFKKQTVINYEEAITQVQKKLDETIAYNEEFIVNGQTVGTIWQSEQKGFSPHYATIGTLAFRLLGIPARYVEGYIVTPEAVKDKKSFEEITLSNNAAHAWTEIYIDQVGWVPVEVTPEYMNTMPPLNKAYKAVTKAENQQSTSTEQQKVTTEQEKMKQIEEEALKIPPQPKKENESFDLVKLLIILWIVLVIVLVSIFIFYSYRKRKVVRSLWREVNSEDVLVQLPASIALVHLWFEKIVKIERANEPLNDRLYKLEGLISPQLLSAYEEAFIAYQAQKYGGVEVEKTAIVSLAKEELINKQSFKNRWMMKWIKGLY